MTHTHCLFGNSCGPDPDRESYRNLGRVLTLVAKTVKTRQETALIQRKTIFWVHQSLWLFLVAWKEQTMQDQAPGPAYRSSMV